MNAFAIASIVLGLAIIATRLPLVLAPERTLAAYRALVSTNARVRGLALVVAAFGLALALPAPRDAGLAVVLAAGLGWFMAGVALLVLIPFPRLYRELAQSVLDAVDGAPRILGVVGVAFGLAFVYLGTTV